jgi:hypothetical protein
MDLSHDIMTAYADSAFQPRHIDSDLSVQVNGGRGMKGKNFTERESDTVILQAETGSAAWSIQTRAQYSPQNVVGSRL